MPSSQIVDECHRKSVRTLDFCHASIPFPGGLGSNPPNRDRNQSDFQRISNFLTVQDGQPCDTPENQNPKIPHEYAQRRKIGPEGPDGRAGGIRTHDPYTPSVVRYQTALQPVLETGGKDTSRAAAWQARKMIVCHSTQGDIGHKPRCHKQSCKVSGFACDR